MIDGVRWKNVRGFPLYEISNEGQVRVKHDASRFGGIVKARYWKSKATGKVKRIPERRHPLGCGADLYVSLSYTGLDDDRSPENRQPCGQFSRREKSIATLMWEHWPKIVLPIYWFSPRSLLAHLERR